MIFFNSAIHSVKKHIYSAMMLIGVVLTSPLSRQPADKSADGSQHISRDQLVVQTASETGIPAAELNTIMKSATFRQASIKSMNTQWEAQP